MAKSHSASYKSKIRQRRQKQKQVNRNLRIGIIVIVALVMIAVVWPRPKADPLSAERLEADPVLGPADAPVTIIEYGDFGCPSCRAWHMAGIRDQIRAEFGESVQFVWRDFPVITAQSPKAAQAGQCAFDQDKFWEYHDHIYEQGRSLSVSDLKAYANNIGLDRELFDQCLDLQQNKAKVNHNLDLAKGLGLRGTPAFIVNGQVLAGPPSFATMKSLIDGILAAQ